MIPRYTRPEMGAIWSDENKFKKWLDVEIATAEAEAEAGLIPKSAARAIRRKGRVDVKRILEIEKEVKHDVIAFTTNVAEHVGREARYLHFGLTSNDVVDTAQGLLIKDASRLLLEDLDRLAEVLKKRAFEFKHTPMVGRTHGIHAEPITFGVKIAIWYAECRRNRERLALRRRGDARGENFRRRRHLFAPEPGHREEDPGEAGAQTLACRIAGDPTRPARVLRFNAGGDCRVA